MAKFLFRLATLLRLREVARDERRAALAEAYRAEDMLRQHQELLAGEMSGLKGSCRQAVGPGAVDVDKLLAAQRYEIALRAQQMQLARQQEMIAAEIERRRETLVQANRDVRVLEKLRQRQAERHRDESAHREIRELDEVAGRQSLREEVV
jgi:flagellar FliJ protein